MCPVSIDLQVPARILHLNVHLYCSGNLTDIVCSMLDPMASLQIVHSNLLVVLTPQLFISCTILIERFLSILNSQFEISQWQAV